MRCVHTIQPTAVGNRTVVLASRISCDAVWNLCTGTQAHNILRIRINPITIKTSAIDNPEDMDSG